MKDVLKYKNFIGSVHFSSPDEVFFGKVEAIKDLVTFEADNVSDLKKAFKEAVDDYIETCKQHKVEPFKSASGTFNVRTSPKTHMEALKTASAKGYKSLNQYVDEALKEKNKRESIGV